MNRTRLDAIEARAAAATPGYNTSVGFSDVPSCILLNAPPVAEPSRRGVGVLEGSAPVQTHERWRAIPGVPHYEVSDEGAVRSFLKKGRHLQPIAETPRLLVPRPNTDGRLAVSLPRSGPGTYKNRAVSRLVMLAFVGPCPDGMEVAHLNGEKTDNRLENLAYVPHRENESHKRRHGTVAVGERNGAAKLTIDVVRAMRAMASAGQSQARIADRFGLSKQMVSDVIRGKTWGGVQ